MDEDKTTKGPAAVRNRDIPILCNVLSVMQSIMALEERRAWQRNRLTDITAHLTGMPRSGNADNKFETVFSELSVLDEDIADKIKRYVKEMRRAERIINGIGSQSMRAFVMMRYMMDIPNTKIMEELNMTRRGFERAVESIEKARDMRSVIWRERYIVNDDK